jgi:hypothetical protein
MHPAVEFETGDDLSLEKTEGRIDIAQSSAEERNGKDSE